MQLNLIMRLLYLSLTVYRSMTS